MFAPRPAAATTAPAAASASRAVLVTLAGRRFRLEIATPLIDPFVTGRPVVDRPRTLVAPRAAIIVGACWCRDVALLVATDRIATLAVAASAATAPTPPSPAATLAALVIATAGFAGIATPDVGPSTVAPAVEFLGHRRPALLFVALVLDASLIPAWAILAAAGRLGDRPPRLRVPTRRRLAGRGGEAEVRSEIVPSRRLRRRRLLLRSLDGSRRSRGGRRWNAGLPLGLGTGPDAQRVSERGPGVRFVGFVHVTGT